MIPSSIIASSPMPRTPPPLTLLDFVPDRPWPTVFDRAIRAASLDHALWLHRPLRADEWLLYAQDSPHASGARGFSRGAIYTREGRLVALGGAGRAGA